MLLAFFVTAAITYIVAIAATGQIRDRQAIAELAKTQAEPLEENALVYVAEMPKYSGEVLGVVTIYDNRAEILEQFFTRYKSPLQSQAKYFVEVADKYKLDYRLLPSIAMQESAGGKIIPENSYNAWGYAVTETQTLRFLSWEQAIDNVARGLKKNYIDKGLRTPEQIMTKYTPASLEKGGAWAKGVNYFMDQLP